MLIPNVHSRLRLVLVVVEKDLENIHEALDIVGIMCCCILKSRRCRCPSPLFGPVKSLSKLALLFSVSFFVPAMSKSIFIIAFTFIKYPKGQKRPPWGDPSIKLPFKTLKL